MFKERLKELRIEKGVSAKAISESINLSRNAIYNYEQGIREPSLEILIRLCDYFDVSADYLIGRSDDY